MKGIDWEWQSMDTAMTNAPLGGGPGPTPLTERSQGRRGALLVDGYGVPIGLAVAGANRRDIKLAEKTLESIPIERPKPTPEESQNM